LDTKARKEKKKPEADFRFVVHQHHQIDHARNLPLHWETPTEFLENAEVHSLMPCNFKHPKVGAFFFLICRCQSDPIEKSAFTKGTKLINKWYSNVTVGENEPKVRG
jgi:hypothetical protein